MCRFHIVRRLALRPSRRRPSEESRGTIAPNRQPRFRQLTAPPELTQNDIIGAAKSAEKIYGTEDLGIGVVDKRPGDGRGSQGDGVAVGVDNAVQRSGQSVADANEATEQYPVRARIAIRIVLISVGSSSRFASYSPSEGTASRYIFQRTCPRKIVCQPPPASRARQRCDPTANPALTISFSNGASGADDQIATRPPGRSAAWVRRSPA